MCLGGATEVVRNRLEGCFQLGAEALDDSDIESDLRGIRKAATSTPTVVFGSAMTEEETVVAFGRKVRDIRQGKGITLEQFALGLGIDPKHMGRIEQGKANPTLRVMVRIAEALSVPFSTLLSE